MKKVYLTRQTHHSTIDILRDKGYQVFLNEKNNTLNKEELIENIMNMDAVVCNLNEKIDEEIFKRCPNVKIYCNYAVGYNNIDIESAKKYGVTITNTKDCVTISTAEFAFTLMCSVSRRVVEADRYVRDGLWKEFDPMLLMGVNLTGKTIGIIGAGEIGKTFAKMCTGFNMKIVYHNRNRNLVFENEIGATYLSKEELLKACDFISIHVPLTDDTYHMIDELEFDLMKNNAILINTSRGPVIKESALVHALKHNKIAGCGIDVFEFEPNVNEEFLNMKNVVLTPHIAGASEEARAKMGTDIANNIIDFFETGSTKNAL